MQITLNGQPHTLSDDATILTLLDSLKLSPEKVAIELNRRLLKSEKYANPLKAGDEVEIVTFVGGG